MLSKTFRILKFLVLLPMWACASADPQVTRMGVHQQTDLSGKWNDTDARLTAQALIDECFATRWLTTFDEEKHRKPSLRVRGVVNKTDEHIDALVFIKSIERAMVNSGKVKVLAQEGDELDSMQAEQQRSVSGHQSDKTPVRLQQESGADFVIAVRIASILDQIEGQHTKMYQIDFELIDSSTGEKAWIGEHQIKKWVKQDKYNW